MLSAVQYQESIGPRTSPLGTFNICGGQGYLFYITMPGTTTSRLQISHHTIQRYIFTSPYLYQTRILAPSQHAGAIRQPSCSCGAQRQNSAQHNVGKQGLRGEGTERRWDGRSLMCRQSSNTMEVPGRNCASMAHKRASDDQSGLC